MKQERLIIFLLASINFTHIIDFMIMMPLGPQLMRIFAISPQEFGLIVSSYTFSAGIAGFIAAFFVDKYDRKIVLLIGYIGFVIGTFACAVAPNYMLLVLARIVAGGFGGLIGAQVFSIVGDLIPFERRGRAMGILSAAFSVASIVGVPFGLYVAAEINWQAPFVIVGGMGLLVIPAIMMILPNITAHIQAKTSKNPFIVVTQITSDMNQLRGLWLAVLLMIGHFTIIPYISPYMVANVGFTEHDLAYIYFVGGVLTFFTSPLVGRFADKYGKHQIFAIFGFLALIPIFLITNMPRIPVPYVLIATAMFFVFASSRFIPANAIITSVVPPQQRGSYMSIVSSLQQLASGFASFFAGLMIVKAPNGELQNYHYVGYVAIIVSIYAILVARNVQPYLQQPKIEEFENKQEEWA